MKKIGLLGGTFNPIHKAHIQLAKAALKEFKLDKILIIPCGLPPHKTEQGIPYPEHRYQMALLATQGIKKFDVSRIEVDRKGRSFAVDTCNLIQKEYPKATIYYIMGLDAINDILSWRKPLELFKICEFIVATRPGVAERQFRRIMRFPILKNYENKIHMLQFNNKISSTEIRRRLSHGKSVSSMLPQPVLKYIKEHKLYPVPKESPSS
ncbi:MAG: nicotinate-nucleotide adenylyltransferase [bacterium]